MMASQKSSIKSDEGEEGGIPLHLLKNLRKGGGAEAAESGSSNGEANNSDNSALVSIGNTSFGFNFDSEDQSPNNSDRDRNENSEDSGDDQQKAASLKQPEPFRPGPVASQTCGGSSNGGSGSNKTSVSSFTNTSTSQEVQPQQQQQQQQQQQAPASFIPRTALSDGPSMMSNSNMSSHNQAAAFAVANLRNIMNSCNGDFQGISSMVTSSANPNKIQQQQDMFQNNIQQQQDMFQNLSKQSDEKMAAPVSTSTGGRKRKADEGDSSAGYHTDDEGRSITMQSLQGDNDLDSRGSGGGKKSKKHLNERKREERNQREKERSLRISKQINDLRGLLSNGGVIVPKGTKSSVLTEAANYIRMLQQHQYRSELDRHQLIQQMQLIGTGAHGAQAARAIRHVAAQNGVWSLGNFGGVPPKSAMSFYQPTAGGASDSDPEVVSSNNTAAHPDKIEVSDYKFIFNSCGVGMAIASLGGAFIDCNQLFCQISNYNKQEICGLTIFNLTARQDLQHAFDLISQMISPPVEMRSHEPRPILLRGSMKNRSDLGLSISLVKGEDGIAKCFCATLIKNPSSPFDTAKPIPVSFDAIQLRSVQPNISGPGNNKQDPSLSIPAFTFG